MSRRPLWIAAFVLTVSASRGWAAEEAGVRTWFTVQAPGLNLTITVPLFQRDVEDRMRRRTFCDPARIHPASCPRPLPSPS